MATRIPRSLVPAAWMPVAAAIGGGALAALIILWWLGDAVIALGFVAGALALLGAGYGWSSLNGRGGAAPVAAEPDWSVARVIADAASDAIAVTDRAGRLICANHAYGDLFPGYPAPPNLPVGDAGAASLALAGRTAWRDGEAKADGLLNDGMPLNAHVTCAGDQMLVWRIEGAAMLNFAHQTAERISGQIGDRLGSAGVMMAMLGSDGRIRAANRVFRARAMGHEEASIAGRDFARFLITDSRALVRFEREGMEGNPLRVVQLPFVEGEDAPILVALLDEEDQEFTLTPQGAEAGVQLRALISLLSVGIALIDRSGRFAHMNDAFARSTGINPQSPPLYPGDLVVREDKTALADAVRRFASGAQHSADMAIRLKDHPDEPVAVTFTGARGIGDAAVMMSLKDTGEESKLKRQVAQATKMQAVGQLAGGVAHDFNNILTAIIGHCDLMLMRHTPGDSDYDDIQQVRANSNRAASLTRQLLAFSRQQTLRPQLLQLPDVISEVSNLLKRLLGETVELVVTHGRNQGAVRADPGQLEQVVVNLAVNARDAMLSKNPHGGGRLTIETLSVAASDVRAMDEDVLPIGDYTALRISDTGTGIPVDIRGKIFEPFFTTKEVGKGTGLGLSTVYGIIKQSGGYIFADDAPGGGARFTLYLPVHSAAEPVRAAVRPPKAKPGDLWGTGTILLVEDEDMVRAVAERALVRQGYTVLTAEHGEAALELLETSVRPDLLISDVVMPVMDGPTMVRQVRQRYADLPILFMSGYAEEQLRQSIDLDQVSFLPKPFSVQQLAEAVRSVMTAK